MKSILDLPEAYINFNKSARARFDRIFSFSLETGRLIIPLSMLSWAESHFGSVHSLEEQHILKINNKLTLESTMFNKLRSDRPMHTAAEISLKDLLADAEKEPFADVYKKTPEDVFGRIKGKFDTTAANVAKYDAMHGLVVFDNPDPLGFTREETIGHFDTALRWISRAHESDRTANFPVIAWNCLWKAGASLVHGHLQVLLGKREHYPMVQLMKLTQDEYRKRYKEDYFTDLFLVHEDLGLGSQEQKVSTFAQLTPKKENEIMILSNKADSLLFTRIYNVLATFTKDLNVKSFNVAVMLPPLDHSWLNFPVITRIVDRGSLTSRTADIASMELLLGQSVVASDPVHVWKTVNKNTI